MNYIDPNELYFGQQKYYTADFFGDSYHTIHIRNMPHFLSLQNNNKEIYRDYLRYSWRDFPKRNNDVCYDKRTKKFGELLDSVKNSECQNPIEIIKRFDGKYIIFHGNHRASVCLFLNKKVPYVEISPENYLKQVTNIPELFYGSKNKNMPYQSIYNFDNEICIGRRHDLLDRIKLFDPKDFKNKTLLDMGCNLGTSCILASQLLKTSKATGVEYEQKIVNAAIRVNTLFAQNIKYIKHDLSTELILQKHDIGFVFSIDQHVNNNKQLAKNIQNNVSNVLYFETHSGSTIPQEIESLFKIKEYIGNLGHRKLYRMESYV